jgi:outer membrane protein assembly factor BamB
MKVAAKPARLEYGVPAGIAVAGVALLVLWSASYRPKVAPLVRVPGPASAAAARAGRTGAVNLAGVFTRSTGVAAKLPGAWPCFRGPRGDGVSPETTPLARQFGPGGPTRLWSADLGEGYAGAAVLGGRVYILDYDQQAKADALRCLSLGDGKEIWRRSYRVRVKRNHGMSRTVPAVTPKYVVSLGPKCHVLCVDSVTGAYRWGMDLVRRYGTRVPPWYAGQCPLIQGDRVILAPGGKALMIAVDCATGRVLWETPNPHRWAMTHSTILPLQFAGRRLYVYCASGGVVGVDAKTGAILWEVPDWKISIANVPTPVPVGEGRLFLSGGYNAGSMMLRLRGTGSAIVAEPEFRLRSTDFGSDQQTPIFYKGYLYGVRAGGQLVCLDLAGRQRWASSGSDRFGLGPYTIADGLIYVMNDTGTLSVVEATPDAYRRVAQAKVLQGHDAWAPMAVAGGLLLCRDLKQMVCLRIAAGDQGVVSR